MNIKVICDSDSNELGEIGKILANKLENNKCIYVSFITEKFSDENKEKYKTSHIEYLNSLNHFEDLNKDFYVDRIFKNVKYPHAFIRLKKNEICNYENYENFRESIGKLIKYCEVEKLETILFNFDNTLNLSLFFKNIEDFSKVLISTIKVANYSFEKYITDEKRKISKIKECYILINKENIEKIEHGVKEGTILGDSINNSRNWSDCPPNDFYPKVFADEANKFLSKHKNIKIKIFEKNQLEKLGMGGIIGVCQGSIHEPRMVVAEYTPNSPAEKTICLVGKGVTFDTGGISIKPSDNMEDMKADMTGAAVVLSSLNALAEMNSPFKIIVCAPMVENMPSHNALRPGDIIKFYNGKTAEIKNTDAEGRLILADALSYVCKEYKPDFVIDMATLTGAACIALGPYYAAIISYFDDFSKKICEAGKKTGDNCWQLPINKKYQEAVVSDVADLCNISKKYCRAGTITAGAFLMNFVDENIQYVHIDIASVSMHSVGKYYIKSIGATGFGVSLLVELLSSRKYI